ncbi:DUF1906 domain-containing protein [Kitasatospora sp. NPDC048194]|uniref:DUF1906 domain-containing protein n=1 Tax=Kitasatospora sp. NPDC048194 TaxID=3364045 RepID=UPI0037152D06
MRLPLPTALLAVPLALLPAAVPGHASAGWQPAAARAAAPRTLPAPVRPAPPALPLDGATQPPEYRYTGAGFDACSAPPAEALYVWRSASPYGAVNIYTSGSQRGCQQPRLTPQWVSTVRAMGWKLVPTHVGLQAPCAQRDDKPLRIDPARAEEQGGQEAGEAAQALQELGLGPGSPVYLDIESYPTGDAVCSAAVVDFTVGWTRALWAAGYRSGFYSSMSSGIADIVAAARAGRAPMPDAIWYARWDGRPTTDGQAGLPDDLWAAHRIHQYRGSADETYGGVTLNIDRDQLDGLVAADA